MGLNIDKELLNERVKGYLETGVFPPDLLTDLNAILKFIVTVKFEIHGIPEEDVRGIIMVKLVKKLPSLNPDKNCFSLIWTIAKNTVSDYIRDQSRYNNFKRRYTNMIETNILATSAAHTPIPLRMDYHTGDPYNIRIINMLEKKGLYDSSKSFTPKLDTRGPRG